MIEVVETIRLQRVLVLRGAEACTHAQVLHSLEKKHGTGNMRGGVANAGNHLVGADLPFAERLKLAKDAGGAATAAATGECSHRITGRILHHDARELAHLLRHGRK